MNNYKDFKYNKTIAIIGYGSVGKAVNEVFKAKCNILVNDPLFHLSTSLDDISNKSHLIFICMPADTSENGEIDTKKVFEVLDSINNHCLKRRRKLLICIKSTLLPHHLEFIKAKNKNLKICYTPEYIRDKSAINDMFNMESLIVGGETIDAQEIIQFYKSYGSFNKKYKTAIVDLTSACILKYMENCFLAMKVSFMNQFYDIAYSLGCMTPWEKMMDAFHQDSRMGNSHYKVPGPDLKRGWGGKCFPKDLKAIIEFCSSKKLDIRLMEEVVNINKEIRKI